MNYGRSLPFLFLLLFSFTGCLDKHSESREQVSTDAFDAWRADAYLIHGERIRSEIERLNQQAGTHMYADVFTQRYYRNRRPFIWIDRTGTDTRADTLLAWLEQVPELGLKKSSFQVDRLTADLQKLRTPRLTVDKDINTVMARVEYNLTQAYLRYVCGQRFGYVNPYTTFNRLVRTDTTRQSDFRRLFDIPTETATDSFVNIALQQASEGRLHDFLTGIQPQDSLYHRLLRAYHEHKDNDAYARKILVNLERSRWRGAHRPTGKHVWVNVSGFILTAADENSDSMLTMKVCGGDTRHQSPLLYSTIERVELNPYWVIPYSIIKKEIAPRHAGNASYFERNRIRIINKKTQEEMNPASVNAAMLKSGQYMLRQDKGAGNSLGRMVFRFPNNFSVFLHDTNNPEAFARKSRAVSHGCIRVERPLDLAVFLMADPQPDVIDRIRISIDLPPLTPEGQAMQADPDHKKMGIYRFSPAIPLFIQYYTVYPNPKGELESYPDPYGYDEVLQKKLNAF